MQTNAKAVFAEINRAYDQNKSVGILLVIKFLNRFKKLQNNCDNEAYRLVQKMPKWIPDKLNGNPVKAYYSLSINFKLQ